MLNLVRSSGRFLVFVAFVGFVAGSGCADSGSSKTASKTSLSGTAYKGQFTGEVEVRAYAMESDGSAGQLLASTTSDTDGNWTLDGLGGVADPVVIEILTTAATRYVDEETGLPIDPTDGEILLSSCVPDPQAAVKSAQEQVVTPLTTIAAESAARKAYNGQDPADAVSAAMEETAEYFFPDPTTRPHLATTRPNVVDPRTSANYDLTQDRGRDDYGLVMAALVKQANDLGATHRDFIQAMARDARDGEFDGLDSTELSGDGTVTVSVGGNPVDLPRDAASDQMKTALDALKQKPNHPVGQKASTQVDQMTPDFQGRDTNVATLADLAGKVSTGTLSSVHGTATGGDGWTVTIHRINADGSLGAAVIDKKADGSAIVTDAAGEWRLRSDDVKANTGHLASGEKFHELINLVVKAVKGGQELRSVVPGFAKVGRTQVPPADPMRDNQFHVFQAHVQDLNTAGVTDPQRRASFQDVARTMSDSDKFGAAFQNAADAGALADVVSVQAKAELDLLADLGLQPAQIDKFVQDRARLFSQGQNAQVRQGMDQDQAEQIRDRAMERVAAKQFDIPPAQMDLMQKAKDHAASTQIQQNPNAIADEDVRRAFERDNFVRDALRRLEDVIRNLQTCLRRDNADKTDDLLLDLDGDGADDWDRLVQSVDQVKEKIKQAVDRTRAEDVFAPGAEAFKLIDQAVLKAVERFVRYGQRAAGVSPQLITANAAFTFTDLKDQLPQQTAFKDSFLAAGVHAGTHVNGTAANPADEYVELIDVTGAVVAASAAASGSLVEDYGFRPKPGREAQFFKKLNDAVAQALEDVTTIRAALDSITDAVLRAERKRSLAFLIINFFQHQEEKQVRQIQDHDGDGFASDVDPNDNDPSIPGFNQLGDSDGDGVPDFIERQTGTNPFDPADKSASAVDSDGDGHPDAVEDFLGADKADASSTPDLMRDLRTSHADATKRGDAASPRPDGVPDMIQDLDQDGFPSDFELREGSDPLDGASVPQNLFGGQTGRFQAPPPPAGTATGPIPGGTATQPPTQWPFPPQKLRDAQGASLDSDNDGLSDSLEKLLTATGGTVDADGQAVLSGFDLTKIQSPADLFDPAKNIPDLFRVDRYGFDTQNALQAVADGKPDIDQDLDGDGHPTYPEIFDFGTDPYVKDQSTQFQQGPGVNDVFKLDTDKDGAPDVVEDILLGPDSTGKYASADATRTPQVLKDDGSLSGTTTFAGNQRPDVFDKYGIAPDDFAKGDPTRQDFLEDLDGDGYITAVELMFDSDPEDLTSVPSALDPAAWPVANAPTLADLVRKLANFMAQLPPPPPPTATSGGTSGSSGTGSATSGSGTTQPAGGVIASGEFQVLAQPGPLPVVAGYSGNANLQLVAHNSADAAALKPGTTMAGEFVAGSTQVPDQLFIYFRTGTGQAVKLSWDRLVPPKTAGQVDGPWSLVRAEQGDSFASLVDTSTIQNPPSGTIQVEPAHPVAVKIGRFVDPSGQTVGRWVVEQAATQNQFQTFQPASGIYTVGGTGLGLTTPTGTVSLDLTSLGSTPLSGFLGTAGVVVSAQATFDPGFLSAPQPGPTTGTTTPPPPSLSLVFELTASATFPDPNKPDPAIAGKTFRYTARYELLHSDGVNFSATSPTVGADVITGSRWKLAGLPQVQVLGGSSTATRIDPAQLPVPFDQVFREIEFANPASAQSQQREFRGMY